MNYTQTIGGPMTPTANLAVNKSRLKVYNPNFDMPTYYLQKGQEFAIELFNPSKKIILAKISLNGDYISQGGLVLKPGQRVFLDRYLDVPKKFLFDTYEVSKSKEVAKAIADNGDFKVEFYTEKERLILNNILTTTNVVHSGSFGGGILRGASFVPLNGSSSTNVYNGGLVNTTFTTNNSSFTTTNVTPSAYFSSANLNPLMDLNELDELSVKSASNSKSIETGRVEKGSNSDQKIKLIDAEFSTYPFHTIKYKMLPISQKINTTEDINVKRYCTNCGAKLGKTDKFCSSCGNKA